MNKADALRDDDRLESPLREAVDMMCAEPIPEEVVERSVTRALQLGAQSVPTVQTSRPKRRHWLTHPRQWLVVGLGAAAMLLLAVVWNCSTSSVLADVIQAVAKKPWMHAVGKGPNDVDFEIWYSPRHGIVGSRQGTQRIFANVGQETMEVFTVEKDGRSSLSRLALDKEQLKTFASAERTYEKLFFGDPTNAFQGGPYGEVSHTQQTVREEDDTFIEHRFTSKVEIEDQRMVTVLRIDAESQLPVSWQAMIGQTPVFSGKVDFPDRGPQTIYAMGVPPDVKIVDQRPSDDLKRILAAWKTGRTQFDSYRAVVVESSSADHRSSGHSAYQVWRKGLKWRVDQLRMPPRLRSGPFEDEVPPAADPKTWWLQRGEKWESTPQTVSDGTLEIRLEPIWAEPRQPDPINPRYGLIKSLEPHRTNAFGFPTTDLQPAHDFHLMPEFWAYPFLFGRGHWDYQTKVHPHPTDGPEGTVLVESHDKNPSKLAGRLCVARYWVDPARSYVVRQMRWLNTGKPDDLPKGLVEMGDPAQSPSGLWYPGVVRVLQNSVSLEDGTTDDSCTRFYVDFESEISDDLFDVHKWGPIK